jgi:hypothetical protein
LVTVIKVGVIAVVGGIILAMFSEWDDEEW